MTTSLADAFQECFNLDQGVRKPPRSLPGDLTALEPDVAEWLDEFAGRSFEDGLYRFHGEAPGELADHLVGETFPWLRTRAWCFASDWAGSQYALDLERQRDGKSLLLLADVGRGDVLLVPHTFAEFHGDVILRNGNEVIEGNDFREWCRQHPENVPLDELCCVGFTIPQFLGGRDDVSNRSRQSLEFYWDLHAQMLHAVKDLEPDTPIRSIELHHP